jgi:hypothetical protein
MPANSGVARAGNVRQQGPHYRQLGQINSLETLLGFEGVSYVALFGWLAVARPDLYLSDYLLQRAGHATALIEPDADAIIPRSRDVPPLPLPPPKALTTFRPALIRHRPVGSRHAR